MNEPPQYYPLTFSQLLVWEGETVAASHFTHLCILVRLKEAANVDCWIEAIGQVVRENEGLRLRMVLQNGDVRQYVSPPDQPVEVPFLDFSHEKSSEQAARTWVEQEIRKRLQIVDSPLFYFAILRLSQKDHRLLLKVHHLVSDGWSMTILTEQIFKHYYALQAGEFLHDPPPTSFVEYILQQTAPRMLAKASLFLGYLFEKMTTAPAAARIRPELPSGCSVNARRLTFPLPPNLEAQITRFSNSNHSSFYLFFLSSILLEIALANATQDAAIGTLFHNRLNPAYQNSIGMFNVILPIRVKVAGDLSFRDLIKRVLAAWKSSIQRQPGRISLQELTTLYEHAGQLFDVLVSYESHLPVEPPEWLHGEADLEPISLMITILDYPAGGYDIEFLYRTEQYSQADIDVIFQQLLKLWAMLLADPDRKIGELSRSNTLR